MKKYRVVIPLTAKDSLREILEFIKKDSPSAAEKVRKKLLDTAKGLSVSPERFSLEEHLLFKEGNYRSVVLWHFKIVYKVSESEVLILKFIHTSRNPELIKKLDDS